MAIYDKVDSANRDSSLVHLSGIYVVLKIYAGRLQYNHVVANFDSKLPSDPRLVSSIDDNTMDPEYHNLVVFSLLAMNEPDRDHIHDD